MFLAGQVLAMALVYAVGGGVPPVERLPARQLTVCLTAPVDRNVSDAQRLATHMFEAINVQVRWARPSDCPADGVRLSFWRETPVIISPGAFGRAFPVEGIRADVFMDRVRSAVPENFLPFVLGHVLAHELAHIAQAERRHSSEGLMKARWAPDEVGRMPWSHLAFSPDDVALIHAGLERRAARFAFHQDRE